MEGLEQCGAYALFGAAWLGAAGWIVLSMSAARRAARHLPKCRRTVPQATGDLAGPLSGPPRRPSPEQHYPMPVRHHFAASPLASGLCEPITNGGRVARAAITTSSAPITSRDSANNSLAD
jgi:hypothetical protein